MKRLFCLAVLPVFFCLCSAEAGAAGESMEEQVRELLKNAISGDDLSAAQVLIQRACQLVESEDIQDGDLNKGFVKVEISQTLGKIYLRNRRRSDRDEQLRKKGEAVLLAVLDEYRQLRIEAKSQATLIEKRLRWDQAQENKKWQELRGYISRANYSTAWTLYHLGLAVRGEGRRQELLLAAIDGFEGFTEEGYRANRIVADCFVGQALCLLELGRYYDAAKLLDLNPVQLSKGDKAFFKRVMYLRIRAYRAMGASTDVVGDAKFYYDQRHKGKSLPPDKTEIEMTVEWARSLAVLARKSDQNPYWMRYRGQLNEVSRIVYSYGEPWASMVAVAVGDNDIVSPMSSLIHGRDYYAAGAYEKALAKVELGLELSDGDRQPVADLNYLQIATLIKLGDRSKGYDAATEFVRKYRHDGRWNEIWQVAVEIGMQLHSQAGADGKPAIDELLAIADLGRFDPADDQMYARSMLYRASMLIDKGEYSQATAIAAGIDRAKAGNGIYWRSVYLAALAAYRQAEQDFADTRTRAFLDRAKEKFSEYARFAEKSDTEDDICPSMRQLGLKIAHGFISLRQPDIDAAIAMADAVEKLNCRDGDMAEGIFAVRIEASVLKGDVEMAGELIDAVIAEQGGGVAAARALAKAGDLLEKKYALLAVSDREDDRVLANATARRLTSIYSFLLRHISKSDDAALRLQAVAVRRRLGYSLIWCGKYDEAVLQFKRVLGEVELSVSGEAVEGLGLAFEGAGDFEGAAMQWASLIQSLNKKSEKWLEANYHLIYCRIRQGRIADASKMLEFFQLRYSHLLSDQWQKKFSTLFEESNR